MAAPEDSSVLSSVADAEDASLVAIATMAMVASILVGLGTFSALETGYVAVGVSFVASITLFVGSVTVFEAGRRVGAELDL